jgi:hypothetical protein
MGRRPGENAARGREPRPRPRGAEGDDWGIQADIRRELFTKLWAHMKTSGDHSMVNSQYPAMRWATIGPDVA